MRAFSYAVHFRSRDKDGGYTIRPAVPKNPMLHANITALCLIERELLPIEVLHCGKIGIFDLLAPVTLTLAQRPSYTSYIQTDIHTYKCDQN